MKAAAIEFLFVLLVLNIVSCTKTPLDRGKYPEAAFYVARQALRRGDLKTYFDSLTTEAVRQTLSNSISLCIFTQYVDGVTLMQMRAMGFEGTPGCTKIVSKYNWKEPDNKSVTAWNQSIRQISRPREMVEELVTLHRRFGYSVIDPSHLDPVEIKSIQLYGMTAKARASWSGEEHTILFKWESSMWRMDTHPEMSKMQKEMEVRERLEGRS